MRVCSRRASHSRRPPTMARSLHRWFMADGTQQQSGAQDLDAVVAGAHPEPVQGPFHALVAQALRIAHAVASQRRFWRRLCWCSTKARAIAATP
jgi:hypothetical protein